MAEDKKPSAGAPSSDTTSALFVSARKKQLEQQETDRRAKEKEEQRLAAEAEVKRLEQEVEERRRKAEEDARRVAMEAAESQRQAEENARRIAEEARARQAQAAADPNSVLGATPAPAPVKAAPPQNTFKSKPAPSGTPAQPGAPSAAKAPPNKKMLIIIGAAVVAVVAAIILAVVLLGGKGSKGDDLVYDPAQATYDYTIIGSYYLGGDYTSTGYFFFSDGTFMIEDAEGTIGIEGTFYVQDNTIMMDTGDRIITMTIIDESTLNDPEGDIFLLTTTPDGDFSSGGDEDYGSGDGETDYSYLDDAPEGYDTFYDVNTGLKFYYPENVQLYGGITGDETEIVTVETNGSYLITFDLTTAYSSFSGTDDEILTVLMDTMLNEYFGGIFGGYDGIEEGSVRNQGADLTGEYGSIALARMNCTALGGGQSIYVYGELTRVDKQNLIVLSIYLFDSGNTELNQIFNDIVASMVYIPKED